MLVSSLTQVEFGYNDIPCIQDASVEIRSGEFVAVTGPNGAAKSTLLKLMLGLLQPWKGNVFLSPSNEEGKKLQVGYVSQQISAFNSGFPSTILEFVRSGRYASGSWFRKLRKEDDVLTENALRQVGMWDLRKRKIGSSQAVRSSGYASPELLHRSPIYLFSMNQQQGWIRIVASVSISSCTTK